MVSVVTPAYNCEYYIEKYLKSLLSQTYSDIEIIIVNDGSTDGTEEIVKRYCEKDNRIKYYSQENKGASSARNFGVEKANGDYLLFVDSDDYISEQLISKVVDKAEKDNADVVCFAHYKVYESEKIPFLFSWNCNEWYDGKFGLQKILRFEIKGYICDKLFRLKKWKNMKLTFEKNRYCEDWAPISYYMSQATRVSFVNEPLYYYVQHDSSAIHTSSLKVISDYDHAIKQILGMTEMREQRMSDIAFFKVKSQVEIFHELYNVAAKSSESVYKISKNYCLPSYKVSLYEWFISGNIKNMMKKLLWTIRIYSVIKK